MLDFSKLSMQEASVWLSEKAYFDDEIKESTTAIGFNQLAICRDGVLEFHFTVDINASCCDEYIEFLNEYAFFNGQKKIKEQVEQIQQEVLTKLNHKKEVFNVFTEAYKAQAK